MGTDEPDHLAMTGWRFLCDTGNIVMLIIDREGGVRFANQYAKTLTGLALEGDHISRMLIVDSWKNPEGVTLLEQWLHHPPPHLMNILTAGELPQTLYVTIHPVDEGYLFFGQKDDAEQDRLSRELLLLNHELTSLSRELNQKNAELAQLNALKNQFLGMAAHDLRNPVGIIINYTEFLVEDLSGHLSSQQEHFLETIQATAARMSQVINNFLDVSIIESGHLNLTRENVELADLVRNVETLLSIATIRRQIRIEAILDPAAMKLMVDGPKIEQVFTNILSNAIEHSPDGGCVTIRSEHLHEGVRFQVEDQGEGIPPDQQKRLFQSFSGTGSKKKSGERSIGLGLVISRKIVEAHGGRMFVESEPGKGSVFGFILPGSCLAEYTSEQVRGASGNRG